MCNSANVGEGREKGVISKPCSLILDLLGAASRKVLMPAHSLSHCIPYGLRTLIEKTGVVSRETRICQGMGREKQRKVLMSTLKPLHPLCQMVRFFKCLETIFHIFQTKHQAP